MNRKQALTLGANQAVDIKGLGRCVIAKITFRGGTIYQASAVAASARARKIIGSGQFTFDRPSDVVRRASVEGAR